MLFVSVWNVCLVCKEVRRLWDITPLRVMWSCGRNEIEEGFEGRYFAVWSSAYGLLKCLFFGVSKM